MRDWSDALARDDFARWHHDLEESQRRFDARDWNFFDRAIPSIEKWRAFGDFTDRVLYVDIETDGGVDEDSITVIGCFDGSEAHTFVRGRDLEKAKVLIEDHPLIVTFNGAQFDMPLIRRRFMYNLFNHIHVDLRFVLRRIGLTGGLKAIEQKAGIERGVETRGLGGWDAVRLWRESEHGNKEALETLLAYNREDTKNLMPLMKRAFAELGRDLGAGEMVSTEGLRCALVGRDSPAHAQMLALRGEILRKPIGLELSPADIAGRPGDLQIGCFEGNQMVGCCILTPAAPGEIQLRQMAVAIDRQGRGVGRVIVDFAEMVARARHSKRIFMHARKSAAGFYARLGYRTCSGEFAEVGLPHFEMEKILV